MRTKYCPHCGSERILQIEGDMVQKYNINTEMYYEEVEPYYECIECNETWEPHKKLAYYPENNDE